MIDVQVSSDDPTNGASSRPAVSCNTSSPAFAENTTAPTPASRAAPARGTTATGAMVLAAMRPTSGNGAIPGKIPTHGPAGARIVPTLAGFSQPAI